MDDLNLRGCSGAATLSSLRFHPGIPGLSRSPARHGRRITGLLLAPVGGRVRASRLLRALTCAPADRRERAGGII